MNLSALQLAITAFARPKSRLPVVNMTMQLFRERGELVFANFGHFDSALYVADVHSLTVKKFPAPAAAQGIRGLAAGSDGQCYFGTTDGTIWRFDPVAGRYERVATGLAQDNESFWGFGSTRAGRILFGLYPTGDFLDLDIATGTARRIAPFPVAKLGQYAYGFRELPNDTVLVVSVGAQPALTIYSPRDGSCRVIHRGDPETETRGFICPLPDPDRLAICYIGPPHAPSRVFNWRTEQFEGDLCRQRPEPFLSVAPGRDALCAVGAKSSRLYRVRDGVATVALESLPFGNRVSVYVHHVADNEFIAVGDNGLVARFDLDAGRVLRTAQIDNASRQGMSLHFWQHCPRARMIVGSHFINMTMFKVDLQSGRCESSLNKISADLGQVNCATELGDRVFLGSYTAARIHELRPERPFEYGVNPRLVASLGDDQNRPIAMVNDGRKLYVATMAEYGHLGGAINVIDPQTYASETYRHFVPDQNPQSLFRDPASDLLLGSTTIHADCGTHAPIARHACLFLWNPVTRAVVHTARPWDADTLHIHSFLEEEGLAIGVAGQRYFLFEIGRRAMTVKPWPLPGLFIGGVLMNREQFYGATEHGLFVLDLKTNTHRMLTETTRENGSWLPELFGRLDEHTFLYDLQGTRLMRAEISVV